MPFHFCRKQLLEKYVSGIQLKIVIFTMYTLHFCLRLLTEIVCSTCIFSIGYLKIYNIYFHEISAIQDTAISPL